MASVFAHGIFAYSLSRFEIQPFSGRIIISGMVLSILPDLDVLSFFFGIPYESVWGHRGFTHSIMFAVVAAFIMAYWLTQKQNNRSSMTNVFIYFFLCTVSHGFLDAMTSGGKGVGFFIPFDSGRYFFDVRPILVSPIGIDSFFSSWGLAVIKSEIKTVGLISFILIASGFIRRLSAKQATS